MLRPSAANPRVAVGGLSLLVVFTVCAGPLPPVNPVVVFAGQSGSAACAGMARVVGEKLIGTNASSGVSLTAAPANGSGMFSPSLDSRDGAGPHFVSAFLIANSRGGCDAGYDDVRYWPKSCADLAVQELANLGVLKPLGAVVSTFIMGPNQHVYLMPAGPGCVTIRKELLF